MISSEKYLISFPFKRVYWLYLFVYILFTSCKKENEIMPLSPLNKPPLANAGRDTLVTSYITSLLLNGNASFDPDGQITKYEWVKLSGPASAIITNFSNSSPEKVLIQKLTAGSYVFQLTVTDDGGLSAKDLVNVFIPTIGQEFIFDNLIWQHYKSDFSPGWDEIFVQSPAKPELFFNLSPLNHNPNFKADIYLKFESSNDWIQIVSAYPYSNNRLNPYTYIVYEPYLFINSYPLDYELIGRKVSMKVKL